MTERDMLAECGTQLMVLKPSSVWSTARADMARKERNAGKEIGDGFEQYAFHRKHVRKAADARDLIVRAHNDLLPGLSSGKYNTRLIYSDGALLLAAIRAADETH